MKFKHFFLVAAILLLSCNFKLAPSYDASATSKVMTASVATNMMYDKIIASSDKNFATYETDYAKIETQIHEIILIDNTRKRAKTLVGMATDVLNRFVKYQNEHRAAVTLNNAQLRSFKDYMHAVWQPLYNAETNLK